MNLHGNELKPISGVPVTSRNKYIISSSQVLDIGSKACPDT